MGVGARVGGMAVGFSVGGGALVGAVVGASVAAGAFPPLDAQAKLTMTKSTTRNRNGRNVFCM